MESGGQTLNQSILEAFALLMTNSQDKNISWQKFTTIAAPRQDASLKRQAAKSGIAFVNVLLKSQQQHLLAGITVGYLGAAHHFLNGVSKKKLSFCLTTDTLKRHNTITSIMLDLLGKGYGSSLRWWNQSVGKQTFTPKPKLIQLKILYWDLAVSKAESNERFLSKLLLYP